MASEMPSLPSTAIGPLVEPRQAFGVQPGHAVGPRVQGARPGSGGTRPVPVATIRMSPEPTRNPGRRLSRLEIGHRDHGVAVEVLDTGQPAMSSSTPRPTNPSARAITVLRRAPSLRTSAAGAPLYIWPPDEHVAQGVDVGDAEAVDVGADVVPGPPRSRECRCSSRASPEASMWWWAGYGFSGRRLLGQIVGQAHRDAVGDEGGGRPAVAGRQVVEGAALIVVAPPAPVLQGLEQALETLGGHVGARRGIHDGAPPGQARSSAAGRTILTATRGATGRVRPQRSATGSERRRASGAGTSRPTNGRPRRRG